MPAGGGSRASAGRRALADFGGAMQVPTVYYCQRAEPEKGKHNPIIACWAAVFVPLCLVVWGFAIAKLIDILGGY
jgi:hypothetical protein